MITFKIDTSDLDEKLRALSHFDKARIHEGIGYILENRVVGNIDAMGLVDTGIFRNSINHVSNEDGVIVQDNTNYGIHLEYGTRSHKVMPKNKKALHWQEGGVDRFSKGHMVSGIQEYMPFRKALVDGQDEVTIYARDKILEYAKSK